MGAGIIAAGRRRGSGGGGGGVANEPDGVLTTLTKTTSQAYNYATWTAPTWDSAAVDTLGAWSSGSPTILTVPAGITSFEMTIAWYFATANVTNSYCRLLINGTPVEYHYGLFYNGAYRSRRISVSPGDTIRADLQQITWNSSGSTLSSASPSYLDVRWFA